MLKSRYNFLFSPSAFQASLQTSTVQANNRTTGAAMSLIKKVDVKEHFAARRRLRLIAAGQLVKPAAAGLPETTGEGSKEDERAFVQDFSLDHSSSRSPASAEELPGEPTHIAKSVIARSPAA
jgi:hypothetical protein